MTNNRDIRLSPPALNINDSISPNDLYLSAFLVCKNIELIWFIGLKEQKLLI